jgi:hypothetical protein
MNRSVIFDHIPKTAGTSMHAVLAIMLPDYQPLEAISNSHSLALATHCQQSFGGHYYYKENEKLSSSHIYCTVLREPVARFISQYNFNREVAADLLSQNDHTDIRWNDPQLRASLELTLEEYLSLGQQNQLLHSYSNTQAKHFAGRMTSCPDQLSEQDLLDAAIHSLEGYTLIGNIKKLPIFVQCLAELTNSRAPEIPQLNTTSQRLNWQSPSQEVLQRLQKANSVDSKILTWASQKFGWGQSKLLNATPRDWNSNVATDHTNEHGTRTIYIENIKTHQCEKTQNLLIEFDVHASITSDDLTIGFAILDKDHNLIYGTNSKLMKLDLNVEKIGLFHAEIELTPICKSEKYSITLALHQGFEHTKHCYHWLDDAVRLPISQCLTSDSWSPKIKFTEFAHG